MSIEFTGMETLIIKLESSELWYSYKQHHHTLYSTYIKKYKKYKVLTWSNNSQSESASRLIDFSSKSDFTRIICLDPQLPIGQIIRRLDQCKHSSFDLIIHAYGDFVRELPALKTVTEQTNKKIRYQFYLPSLKLCRIYKTIFNTGQGIYHWPLYYEKIDSKNVSLFFKVFDNNEFKAGYLGRLHESKNLIETITLLARSNYFNYGSFYLAGALDLASYPYGEKSFSNKKNYLIELTAFIQSLDSRIKDKIYFMGDLRHEELSSFLKKLDVLINLSTFHGECFGIAPRQALGIGVPLLLTDWGGFSDLKKESRVKLLKVNHLNKGIARFDQTEFQEKLEKLFSFNKIKKNKKVSTGKMRARKFQIKMIKLPTKKKWDQLMSQ